MARIKPSTTISTNILTQKAFWTVSFLSINFNIYFYSMSFSYF